MESFAQSILISPDWEVPLTEMLGVFCGDEREAGFGFITSLKPEILLIDETLAVGDDWKKAKRLKGFVANSGVRDDFDPFYGSG